MPEVSTESPLRALHEAYARGLRQWAAAQVEAGVITADATLEAGVEYLPFGAGAEDGDGPGPVIDIVATYGLVEAEYAAIRRGAAIFDRHQRGVIRVTGGERRDFLNRLLTQQLADLEPETVRQSFLTNRKGRIEADLVMIERGDDLLIDLDRAQLAGTMESLDSFLFAEDVALADATGEFHRLAVHGGRAMEVLAAATGVEPLLLAPMRATTVAIEEIEITVARVDQTGEVGLELLVPREAVGDVWKSLLAADEKISGGKRRVRPAGWYAFNIARIEAGLPLFNIDFGPTNLPHETGILHDRVSFRKGCYPGQEIVARMENLGRPKQQLVGLRIEGDLLPVAGAQVFEKTKGGFGQQIGVVTSSTLSPMLGAAPIAFAMLKSQHIETGVSVIVNAEGKQASATVHALQFWPEKGNHGDTEKAEIREQRPES